MKLVKLSILRSLLLKRDISCKFENAKEFKSFVTNFVLPPIFMIDMVGFGHVALSSKQPIVC